MSPDLIKQITETNILLWISFCIFGSIVLFRFFRGLFGVLLQGLGIILAYACVRLITEIIAFGLFRDTTEMDYWGHTSLVHAYNGTGELLSLMKSSGLYKSLAEKIPLDYLTALITWKGAVEVVNQLPIRNITDSIMSWF